MHLPIVILYFITLICIAKYSTHILMLLITHFFQPPVTSLNVMVHVLHPHRRTCIIKVVYV